MSGSCSGDNHRPVWKKLLEFSRQKFLDGLSAYLQDRLLCLEFTSFDQLIEAAERPDSNIEQREARQKKN